MDCVLVSMPYGKFDSRWFANVPNINLGIVNAMLSQKGRQVKTFHFHLEFLHFLKDFDLTIRENFERLSTDFGVEYLSLDYVFASILLPDHYKAARDRFEERLGSVGMTLDEFEQLRGVAEKFVQSCFARLSPHLEKAKLLGMSSSHYQLSGSLLICAMVKQVHPDIPTILGGKDCSGPFGYELLSCVEFVDFVGNAECEITIESLIEHIEDVQKPFFNVLYRDDTGEIRASESKQNLSRDSLPFPKYDFEDIPVEIGEIILPLELGRGCPWGRCTFCPDASYNVRCQSRTAKGVAAEIDYYQDLAGELKNFLILDSDSLKEPQLILELSKYLKGRDLSFHFAEFRAPRLSKALLEALLDFGDWVSPFQIGIETFSDRVLGLMKKGVSALKNVEVLKMVVEVNIPMQFNLFTSYPDMTYEDLLENLRIMDSITHLLVCENIQIYPGEFYLPTDCPVFLNIDNYGLEKNHEAVFSDIFEDWPMPSYSNYPPRTPIKTSCIMKSNRMFYMSLYAVMAVIALIPFLKRKCVST